MEMNDNEKIEEISRHMSEIIRLLGEDTSRQGLVKTPVRAAKLSGFLPRAIALMRPR